MIEALISNELPFNHTLTHSCVFLLLISLIFVNIPFNRFDRQQQKHSGKEILGQQNRRRHSSHLLKREPLM